VKKKKTRRLSAPPTPGSTHEAAVLYWKKLVDQYQSKCPPTVRVIVLVSSNHTSEDGDEELGFMSCGAPGHHDCIAKLGAEAIHDAIRTADDGQTVQ
jgi:hypothetical protein